MSGRLSHPLTLGQELFVLIRERNPVIVPVFAHLAGPLDVDAFVGALHAVIDHHEALRANIGEIDGELRQWSKPAGEYPRPVLKQVPARDREEFAVYVGNYCTKEVTAPLDIAADWLIRIYLFRWRDDDHLLCLLLHHAVCDGLGARLLLDDLVAAYQATAAGRPAFDAPPTSFFRLAEQERSVAAGDPRRLAFWLDQLDERSGPPSAPAPRTVVAEEYTVTLDRAAFRRLAAAQRACGATVAAAVLAAWLTAVGAAQPGRPHFVAIPYAGRRRPEAAAVVGEFAQILNVRFDDGDPELSPASVARTLLRAFDAASVPLLTLATAWEQQGGQEPPRPRLFYDYTRLEASVPPDGAVAFLPWWPHNAAAMAPDSMSLFAYEDEDLTLRLQVGAGTLDADQALRLLGATARALGATADPAPVPARP